MFARKIGNNLYITIFPSLRTAARLSNKRRLKVRYKRFSIRQLIWNFSFGRKKNSFLSLFVLERFRLLISILLARLLLHRLRHACIDSVTFFFSLRVSHTLIANRYSLSYKSDWLLFCIHFAPFSVLLALPFDRRCWHFTFYLCANKNIFNFATILTIRCMFR